MISSSLNCQTMFKKIYRTEDPELVNTIVRTFEINRSLNVIPNIIRAYDLVIDEKSNNAYCQKFQGQLYAIRYSQKDLNRDPNKRLSAQYIRLHPLLECNGTSPKQEKKINLLIPQQIYFLNNIHNHKLLSLDNIKLFNEETKYENKKISKRKNQNSIFFDQELEQIHKINNILKTSTYLPLQLIGVLNNHFQYLVQKCKSDPKHRHLFQQMIGTRSFIFHQYSNMQIKKKITRIKYNYIRRTRNISSKAEMFKFVPFLLNNFVDFLQVLNFEAEEYYLQQILQKKPLNERYYSIIDLIIIFNDQQLKNLRLLWKLYLRKSIPQKIIDQIQSKKMQFLYQRKVDIYIFQFYDEKGYYKRYVQTQVEAEGHSSTKERFEELWSKIKNNQINFSDYPVNQQKFEQKIKLLLQKYINEDTTNTITHPQNFLAIIDIVTYLHDIEGFSVYVHFNARLRKTFLSLGRLQKYLSCQNQPQPQSK